MSGLVDIKRRMQSVKQTRQITGAMQTVSVAKMRKAAELYENSRAYVQAINDLVAVTGGGRYSSERTVGDGVLVVFSSDRGLCGAFDQDIFKCADRIITDGTVVIPIGKTAAAHYASHPNVDLSLVECYCADKKSARKICERLLALYDGGARSVAAVYCEHGRGDKGAICAKLFPVPAPRENGVSFTEFDPDLATVIDAVIPLYAATFVYNALINNISAEHTARHAAMAAATRSADAMTDALSVAYNRARQSSVTSQITEIVGSTQAIGQGGDR